MSYRWSSSILSIHGVVQSQKYSMEKYTDPQWKGLDLSDNWRSTQTIIDAYSLLRSVAEKSITAKESFVFEHPMYILSFEVRNFRHLKSMRFCVILFKENQVVCRGTELSERLKWSSNDIKDCWKFSWALKIILSIKEFKNNNLKSAIDIFRSVVVGLINPDLSYKDLKIKIKESRSDYDLNSQISALINEFSDFKVTLAEWTIIVEKRLTSLFNLKTPIAFELKRGTFSPYHKRLMSDLFAEDITKSSFSISTIHKVKGWHWIRYCYF